MKRCLLFFLLSAGSVFAQFPAIQLHTITPLGGKAGASFELVVSGLQLDEADTLIFDHPGISAKAVMREDEFLKKSVRVAGKFTVHIKPDVPPGLYEARVGGFYGLSNPRRFVVETADRLEQPVGRSADKAIPFQPGQVYYGFVEKDQFDYFSVEAKKGQALAIEVHAERLDSRLDAALQIGTAQDLPLTANNDAIRRDPLLYFTAPADGRYLVKVHDFTYRGGKDYFYRLTISARPHLRYVWPPAGEGGKKSTFTLNGLNLPGREKQVELALPADDTVPAPGSRPSGLSAPGTMVQVPEIGPVWVGLSSSPVVTEQPGDNDAVEKAMHLSWPVEAAARFERDYDEDWYTFDLKNKEAVRIEVYAERMGCPADPLLRFYKISKDAEGAQKLVRILESDDDGSKVGGSLFGVGNRDAAISWTADQDGRYAVQVVNQFGIGREHYLYRLSVRRPVPGFQLMVSLDSDGDKNKPYPASPVMRKGGSALLSVHALRADGFKGAITLRAEGLPAGYTTGDAHIAEGASSARFIIMSTPDAKPWSGMFRLVGEAEVAGKTLRREARFATLLWPVNNLKEEYLGRRLTPSPSLGVMPVVEPVAVQAVEEKTWESYLGGSLEIPVLLEARGKVLNATKITPVGIPGMGQPPSITLKKDQKDGKLKLDFVKQGKNAFKAGEFAFLLKADTESEFQFFTAEDKKRVEEEKKLIEGAHKQAGEAVKQADLALKQAQATRDTARKEIPKKEALTEEERKKQLAAAEEQFKQAEQAAKDAKARVARAKKALDAASKEVKDAATKVKPKKVKFSVYSKPIRLKLDTSPFRIVEVKLPERLPPGGEYAVPVMVKRLYGFQGSIDLTLTLPKGAKGLSAAKVTLAKDQTTGTLTLKVAKDVSKDLKASLLARSRLRSVNLDQTRELALLLEAVPPPPPVVPKKPEAPKPPEPPPSEAAAKP